MHCNWSQWLSVKSSGPVYLEQWQLHCVPYESQTILHAPEQQMMENWESACCLNDFVTFCRAFHALYSIFITNCKVINYNPPCAHLCRVLRWVIIERKYTRCISCSRVRPEAWSSFFSILHQLSGCIFPNEPINYSCAFSIQVKSISHCCRPKSSSQALKLCTIFNV